MAVGSGRELSLGEELAQSRRRRGLTGRQLGEIVGMSQAKISRLETGAGTAEPSDVEAIARALGLGDDDVRRLTDRAAVRMRTRMTDWQLVDVGLVRSQDRMGELEAGTVVHRVFQPIMVHGLLQTSEYARSVLSKFDASAAGFGTVAQVVSARMRRQEILADRGRRFRFLFAESALANLVCPAAVMPGQLERLREAAGQDNIEIRVVPFERQWAVPPLHSFDILDDRVVQVDLLDTGLTTHGGADVRRYREVFDALEQQAAADLDAVLDRYLDRYLEMARPRRRPAAVERPGAGAGPSAAERPEAGAGPSAAAQETGGDQAEARG